MATKRLDQVDISEMRREHRKMRAALSKITDLYAKAPGGSNPTPTTKLVWGMYQVALKAWADIKHR